VSALAGLALFTQVPVNGSYVADLLPPLVLVGVGAGLSFPSLMTLAMSGVEPSQAGLASGLVNTTQQVGGAIGLAVLATLSSTRTASLLHEGKAGASALTSGYHLAWTIGAALLVAGIAGALTILRPSTTAEAEGAEPQPLVQEAEIAYSEAA
jgi:hypothetical protein